MARLALQFQHGRYHRGAHYTRVLPSTIPRSACCETDSGHVFTFVRAQQIQEHEGEGAGEFACGGSEDGGVGHYGGG